MFLVGVVLVDLGFNIDFVESCNFGGFRWIKMREEVVNIVEMVDYRSSELCECFAVGFTGIGSVVAKLFKFLCAI